MSKTAFTTFKFARFLYLAPFLFGYAPGFSPSGSRMDIIIAIGAFAYCWLLRGIWLPRKDSFGKKTGYPWIN